MIWLLLIIPVGVVLYLVLKKKKKGGTATKVDLTFSEPINK